MAIKIKDGNGNVIVSRNLQEQVAKNQRDIEDLANQTDTEVEALKERVTTTEEDIAAIKDGTTIDSFKKVEDALDLKADKENTYTKTEVDQILTSKINIQSIEVTGASGTLTIAQLAGLLNNQDIMIKRANVLYYKSAESDTLIHFERVNMPSSLVDGVYHKTYESIRITKSTGEWIYTPVTYLDVYSKDKVDELLENAGGGLDLLWTNENSKTAASSFIIQFDITKYKGVIIEFRASTGNTTPDQYEFTETLLFANPANDGTLRGRISYINNQGVLCYRTWNTYALGLNIDNCTKYTISSGQQLTGQSDTLVPQVIYGIK